MDAESPFCLPTLLPLTCIGSKWNPVIIKPKDPLYPPGYHLSGLIQRKGIYLKTTTLCQTRYFLLAPVYYIVLRFDSKQPATYVKLVRSKRVFLFQMGVISPQICSAGRGEAGCEDRQQGLAQVGGQKQVLRRRN